MKKQNNTSRIAVFLGLKILEIALVLGLVFGSYALSMHIFNQSGACTINQLDRNVGDFGSHYYPCPLISVILHYFVNSFLGAVLIIAVLFVIGYIIYGLIKWIKANWKLAGELIE